jgi:hypothetical protein
MVTAVADGLANMAAAAAAAADEQRLAAEHDAAAKAEAAAMKKTASNKLCRGLKRLLDMVRECHKHRTDTTQRTDTALPIKALAVSALATQAALADWLSAG